MGGQAKVEGPRYVIDKGSEAFPEALRNLHEPPERLYVIGDPAALQEGLAVVGARKATPYGIGCAARFAGIAAGCGVAIVSGGARGCDSEAHRAAIRNGVRTVSFLGGGCDCVYPAENLGLFRQIVGGGGALASEQPWGSPPLPWMFRARNRLIAGLAKATLIVEAGLPSGTFSTADEALAANREVLVVPGAVTSRQSLGANRLICQGATPVVDDETFHDALFSTFGVMSPVGQCAKGEAEEGEARREEAAGGARCRAADRGRAACRRERGHARRRQEAVADDVARQPAARRPHSPLSWRPLRLHRRKVVTGVCRVTSGVRGTVALDSCNFTSISFQR